MVFYRCQQGCSAVDIDQVEICPGAAANRPRCMDDSVTVCHQLLQGPAIAKITCYQLNAPDRQCSGLCGIANEGANAPALGKQGGAKLGADKAGGAGYGNQATVSNQAEATLRRNSSVIELSASGSWAAMKSRRALARDNLPEDVLGRE